MPRSRKANDGVLRDDEQASQPGEPSNHVAGETVGHSAEGVGYRSQIDKWHHGDGCA